MENTEEYRKLVAELLVGRKERIYAGNGTCCAKSPDFEPTTTKKAFYF